LDTVTLTKDSHKIFNVVWQVNSHLALAALFPDFAQDVDLLAELSQIMLFNLLLAKDTHDRALWHFFSICANTATPQDFSPNVSKVSIFSTLPTRLIRLLDIQARLERIAMRDLWTAVDS
jgi:hypothetical protein